MTISIHSYLPSSLQSSRTVLMEACVKGVRSIVQLLMEKGSSVNETNEVSESFKKYTTSISFVKIIANFFSSICCSRNFVSILVLYNEIYLTVLPH